jgi:hypothetical protein
MKPIYRRIEIREGLTALVRDLEAERLLADLMCLDIEWYCDCGEVAWLCQCDELLEEAM